MPDTWGTSAQKAVTMVVIGLVIVGCLWWAVDRYILWMFR